MKTVLHIITGLEQGGAEAVLHRLCTHDDANLHRVVSLTGSGVYGPVLSEAGIEVASLEMPRGRVSRSGLRKLWRTLRDTRPDVVQTWMYHANLIGGTMARLAGIHNVLWGIRQSDLDPGRTSRCTLMVDRACARLSGIVPRKIVCCASKALTAHAERGYNTNRMMVIYNGYDLSAFRPDTAARQSVRRALGIGDDEPVVGFVARCHPYKGHGYLLRSLAMLRERGVRPTCLLAGQGIDQANTELASAIAAEGLSDQVRLLGPRGDVGAVMNALDLHVMSSVTEGFPNVLAEAMACGTPCVSTDVGDAAQIVGRTGAIVAPRDPAALADAIALMLNEFAGESWTRRQEAARKRIVDNFSVKRMVGLYNDAWFGEGGDTAAPQPAIAAA